VKPALTKRCLGLLRAITLPLLVLTATQLAIRTVARYCGEDPGRNRTWVHWDAYRYIDIARRGYVEVESDPMASNTGWFPGYSLLTRLVSETTGMRIPLAGRVVSAAGLLGFLTVLGGALLPVTRWPHRLLILLIAGFFPGWMYFHAVFPQSLLVFFTLGAVALAARGRWLLSGLSGALAAFTYPTGVVVIVPLTVQTVLAKGLSLRQRVVALVQGPGVAALGLGVVAVLHRFQVGRWDAYVRFQRELGAGLFNPLAVLVGHLRPLITPRASPETLIAVHTAVTTLLLLGAAVAFWCQRERMRPMDAALLVYGAALWVLVNAAGPDLSIYRQAAAMVCVVPLLARLRPVVLAGLLVVLLPMGIAMAVLFFQDVLV
jgi:hypothetical protein